MNVTLISKPSLPVETLCGYAATVCTNSKDAKRALRGSLSSGHESIIEHACYTFEIEGISRVTLAQLTRHRIASFSVQSQRYCRVWEKGILPASIPEELRDEAIQLNSQVFELYNRMIAGGVKAEDARYILPEGTPTRVIMTMNLRELRHFLTLRCCNRAQWEIRELAMEILKICQKESMEIFGHAGPACARGKCPEGMRSCGRPWSNENEKI